MEIPMSPPNPLWPEQFAHISSQLTTDLTVAGVNFRSVIHIGSTSIPDLNAKPIIDIMIVVAPHNFFNEKHFLPQVCDALRDGEAQGGYYYIGNGGLRGRWSFKINLRDDRSDPQAMPWRNVYVVPEGGICHQSAVTLRDALRDEGNKGLREEYGSLKWELAARSRYEHIWEYAEAKDKVIEKILRRAGWTDAQIDQRLAAREHHWPEWKII